MHDISKHREMRWDCVKSAPAKSIRTWMDFKAIDRIVPFSEFWISSLACCNGMHAGARWVAYIHIELFNLADTCQTDFNRAETAYNLRLRRIAGCYTVQIRQTENFNVSPKEMSNSFLISGNFSLNFGRKKNMSKNYIWYLRFFFLFLCL